MPFTSFDNRIAIAADADRVWALTSDLPGWPAWNPNVTRVEALDGAALAEGRRFRLSQPLQPPTIWRVVEVGPRRFRWKSEVRGTSFDAAHDVTEIDGGAESLLTLTADDPGWLLMLLGPVLRLALLRENRGLRRAAEDSATG